MGIRLTSILGNSQKLDGGAMFGNAPKALWTRWATPDDQNRINLACRALLVETAHHRILFESGIGAYMEPALRERYGVVEAEHVLLANLAELGLDDAAITDVVLSHLHFDHAGGLLAPWSAEAPPRLLFPNARFHVGREAWARACAPHSRDRASFVPELNRLLEQSGRLNLLEADAHLHFDELELRFFQSSGHTPGMMCSDLRWSGQRLVFAADLIPGAAWVHLPITMGYDRFPECLIDEKASLLADLVAANGWLFFTHDEHLAAAPVTYDAVKHKYGVASGHASFARLEAL